jgi:hypothetical protein
MNETRSETKGEANMNSNRRNVFFGFAALVVLVAVLAFWSGWSAFLGGRSPALRSEDASGAIGAVQKLHEPQIAQQDVILGDEATRQEQSVLYADFLNDSAKLQSISNELDSKQANAKSNLQAFSDELQARYARSAQRFAESASKIAARENNKTLAADVSELSAKLGTKLSEADMNAINAKAAAITAAAGARSESRITIAQRLVNEAIDAMQSRAGSMAAARLSAATDQLDSRAVDGRLADQSDYLQAITLEARSVNEAQSKIASNRLGEASIDLASRGIDMESRAVKNMASRLYDESEMGTRLQAMNARIESANRLAANQASVMAARASNISAAAGVRAAFNRANAEYAAKTASAISFNMASLQNYLNARPQAAARLDAKLLARAADNRMAMAKHVADMGNLAARPYLSAKINNRNFAGEAAEMQSRLGAKSN